jgi:hypothetical protein
MTMTSTRIGLATIACAATFGLGACGSDDDDKKTASNAAPAATSTTAGRAAADLAAVKTYLLQHTRQLVAQTDAIDRNAQAYEAAVKADAPRAEIGTIVKAGQSLFAKANPAYEQMEGVVAGVPELADFDVIIDAGADASDPENAVPFSIKTADGRTFKQPGNFNYLIETALFGTEPKWSQKADLDGDGKVAFGEALPDAGFYAAAAADFARNAKDLDAAAQKWQPTLQDALTALVVMTPTMSEYFNAWKNSRFIAGDRAQEKAFVVASRLQDIADILGGLKLVYGNVQPAVARADAAQAAQTGQSLEELVAFATRLRDEEAGGKKFTAGDADTLGSEAQKRAEAIAGQVSQAAGQLGIELES